MSARSSGPKRFRIGVINADAQLLSTCGSALYHLGTTEPLHLMGGEDLPKGFDLLVLSLEEPLERGIQLFARLRKAVPEDFPIILVSRAMDATLAVELVKCGAEDFIGFPFSESIIRRKGERALLGLTEPVIDPRLLDPLQADGVELMANRRRAFRARTLEDFPASVRLRLPNDDVRVEVLDLSLPNDDVLGGMGWRAEPAAAERLPLATWGRGTTIPGGLELTNARGLIPLRAFIVRFELPPPGPIRTSVHVGVQYALDNPQDERTIRNFWTETQRRVISPPRTPVPLARQGS